MSNSGGVKQRSTGTLRTTAGGAATGEIGFSGRRFAKVHRVRVLDAQFDDNYDVTITDAAGRTVVAKTGITAATDLVTGADVSDDAGAVVATVGSDLDVSDETNQVNGTAIPQLAPGAVYEGPLTVTIANGGNAVTGSVDVILEFA